jgi:hypothetical protein
VKFELKERYVTGDPGDTRTVWEWEASAAAFGVVAVGPKPYATEKEARSSIAIARKAMVGAKFAKVEVVEPNPEVEVEPSYVNTGSPFGI